MLACLLCPRPVVRNLKPLTETRNPNPKPETVVARQDGFVDATGSQWTRVFFIAWWVLLVFVLLIVLVSIILDVFIVGW